MSKPRSQTINIFLPTGNSKGIRKVGRSSNSNVRLFEVPRTELGRFCEMPEAAEMGIYFLVGSGQLYIGQTTDLSKRIKEHDKTKAFWQRVFIVVLNNDFRTLDHLYCLEKAAIEYAQAAGRLQLENVTAGNHHRHLHDSIRSDCENIFDEIDTLLSVLNQDFFEIPEKLETIGEHIAKTENTVIGKHTGSEESILIFCRSKDKVIRGKGCFIVSTGEVLLLKGTMISVKTSETLPAGWRMQREKWLEQKDLVFGNDPDYHVLQSDQLCKTPSMAAALVFGNNRNGWVYWRNEQGRTLDSIYRT